jgi:hypothetical protein
MKLPKGTYFVGDPCYAIAEKKWDKFVDAIYEGDPKGHELNEFEGVPLFCAGTAFGDGCFEGTDKEVYGVDAGLIGCVPKKLFGTKFSMKRLNELGHVYTFKHDFQVFEDQGTFYIDDIVIKTGD